jgi:RHS repeat-associated protein
VALYTRPSSGSVTTRYLLHDHQGSVAEIVGGSEVSESFGAYGERRDPADWSGPIGSGDATAIAAATPRGYTMHGHLEASALIHMNGRVADALTGRFLSPDPYVPYPGLTQSFNRYSYVHNNPLTYTDPSGFTLEFGGLFDIDGGISLSFKWGGRKHSRQQAPSPVKGCFVPAASGCYGKAPASGLFDIVFDVLRGPMPNYGRYDDLVLYYNDPNGFGRFENEIILVEDIATGVFYEFILLPIEEAAAGRLYSAACKSVKLCRIAERFGGRLLDYAVDKGKRFLKRKVENVPNGPTIIGRSAGAREAMWSGKKITNELAETLDVDRTKLGSAVHRIKDHWGLRGDHNVTIGRATGDVYDSRTGELLGNIFDEID